MKKQRYTRCYSSPFHYVYDDKTNKLMLKTRIEAEAVQKQEELEAAVDKEKESK